MAIGDLKIASFAQLIASLPVRPNATAGFTAEELQAYWDGSPEELRLAVNGLIDALLAVTDGASGADQIGATGITGLSGATVQALLEALKTLVDTKAVADDTYTEQEVDDLIDAHIADLAGTGRTTETVKQNTDDIAANAGNIATNAAEIALRALISDIYTRLQLQTSGQAFVHWENITNKPNFADDSWKAPVATYADLPITGNELNDQRQVLDDGDGKQAIYICIATTGTREEQWDKIADVDWTNDHSSLINLTNDDHPQYFRADGVRPMSGNIDMDDNAIVDALLDPSPSAPTSVEGKVWYDSVNHQLKVYNGTGWQVVSGAGAVVQDIEIVATSGQTVFDISDGGTQSYNTGDGTMKVYLKNAQGLYERFDNDDFTETDSETVTMNTGRSAGDQMFFEWQKNIASIVDSIADGSINDVKLSDAADQIKTRVASHIASTSNPHSVTTTQIGAKPATDFIDGTGATVPTTGWTSSVSGKYQQYIDVTATGMTADYEPHVKFAKASMEDAEASDIWVESVAGAIRFWSVNIPENTLTFDWTGVKF